MQQAMIPMGRSGIELSAHHGILQWMLMLVSPRLVINGQEQMARWGPQFFPVPPGQYQVRVYFPWFFQQACSAIGTVNVYDGHATCMRYDTAFLTFMSGTLRELGHRPM